MFADVTAEKEDGAAGRHEGRFARAIFMQPVPAESGYSRRTASIWAPSSRRRHPPIAVGAMTAKSLYITARTGLYRIKLAVAGQKLVYQ